MGLIYTAQSKTHFYCRDAVCEFVFNRGHIPLHPFRMFNYFLGDRVPRQQVREANAAVIGRVDEVWTFGSSIANGVLVEIEQAVSLGIPVRHFSISAYTPEILPLHPGDLVWEEELSRELAGVDVGVLPELLSGRLRLSELRRSS